MLPIHTILCPVDFSPLSLHALDMACMLAADYHAQMIVLHVKEPALPLGGLVQTEPPHETERLTQSLRDLAIPQDVPTQFRLEEGSAADVITSVAREVGCDIIVISTHGRGGLGRVLLGSVTETVTRLAPCMVLVVKADSVTPRAG